MNHSPASPNTVTSADHAALGAVVPHRHDGKVAIITGASRGIGKVVALRLAAEGARVVVAAKTEVSDERHPGTIHDTVSEITAAGGEAIAVRVDVRDEAQIVHMVERAVGEFGGVHIMFNNAGAISLGGVLDTPLKRFDLMTQVNVRACIATAQQVLPHMIAQRWGHIVNFSPPLQTGASVGMAPYMTTKYGMTRVALAIAAEHRSDNVAANAFWPVTMIRTAATEINGLGDASQWRTPTIIADALAELFAREPGSCTGRELTDEEILREAGVTDFSPYWVLGKAPEHRIEIVGENSLMR